MQELNEMEIESVNGAGRLGWIIGFVAGGIGGAKAVSDLQDAINEFGERHNLN